jgi:hypothetical protein
MVGAINGQPPPGQEHIMSSLTDAMIINGAVLIAVLEGGLGPHRKIGRLRILRPLVTIALAVPLFIDRPVTHGNGLLVELAGIVTGLLCGLVITTLMRVYRSPETGKPASAAGLPYAIVWTLIVGARAAFSYGASNWFPAQLAQWCAACKVTGAAITDGLIFMAVTMVLVRTLGLSARATWLPAAPARAPVPQNPEGSRTARHHSRGRQQPRLLRRGRPIPHRELPGRQQRQPSR